MNPKQILAALAEMYAACTTYRDTGCVVTRYLRADGHSHTDLKPFTTAFVRPNRICFEYLYRFNEKSEWDRHIVWADGADVRTRWDVRGRVERPESLRLAVSAALGVSDGSSYTIPALLMPDRFRGPGPTRLVDLISLGDERLGDVTCYRISGRDPPADPARVKECRQHLIRLMEPPPERCERGPRIIWVDRGTLLIRRVEESKRFETFRTQTVTEYRPEVGVAIADRELRFTPRSKKPAWWKPDFAQ